MSQLVNVEVNSGNRKAQEGGGGGGWGVGRYSGFQVTRLIEWGQKSKPKKKQKGFQQTPKNP